MNLIFELGILLLPFENLCFAPSEGWAALTPIVFVIYNIFNIKLTFNAIKKYKVLFLILLSIIPITLINYIKFPESNFSNLIGASISIILGLNNLISFDIYFRQKHNKIEKIIKFIVISYGISLLIGWIQFITIKMNIDVMKQIFILIEKRSYIKYNRVQFTFTEPSFLGMHLFGILLPVYMYTKNKKIFIIFLLYCISGIIISSSLRFILDIAIVSVIYFISKNIKNIKLLFCIISVIILFNTVFSYFYNNNYRLQEICDKGIYADGSLASRYFRINASVNGYKDNIVNFIIGYGIGNSIIPIRDGYDIAKNEYESSYLNEVKQLGNVDFTDDSVSYCLYIRIISEFGIVMLVLSILYFIKKIKGKRMALFFPILLYIYIQFESYAFYSIWLYVVMLNLEGERKKNEEISNNNNI